MILLILRFKNERLIKISYKSRVGHNTKSIDQNLIHLWQKIRILIK